MCIMWWQFDNVRRRNYSSLVVFSCRQTFHKTFWKLTVEPRLLQDIDVEIYFHSLLPFYLLFHFCLVALSEIMPIKYELKLHFSHTFQHHFISFVCHKKIFGMLMTETQVANTYKSKCLLNKNKGRRRFTRKIKVTFRCYGNHILLPEKYFYTAR